MRTISIICALVVTCLLAFLTTPTAAQPCNTGYTFTASPPPVAGEYQSGQTVTFCYTVTNWTIVNVNWFHGISMAFGTGWDMSTLAPGPPPPTCGTSGGTWGWYNICDGTSGTALPPMGPGYFFDLDNDGNPGNNFGDLCSGAVDWEFCFSITTASGAACVDGASLNVTVNSYGDSESGSWGSAGCGGDALGVLPATLNCCSANAGGNGAVVLCTTSPAVNLASYLGGTPDAGGTWTAPGGGATTSALDPASATSGNYTYTVTSGNCSSSAVVAVTINQPPAAGADGFLNICSNNAPTNLFTLIAGAQPAGVWTAPGGGAFGGWYDPAVHDSGIYTYTIQGIAPCAADQSTVLVNESAPPNAGQDGATTVCADGAAIDLSALLIGPDAGGNWSAPGGGGTTSTFTPGTSTPGPYTYTVAGTPPCGNDQAVVTVTLVNPVNAGTDGSVTVCSDGAAIDLFTSLGGGPGTGGTWAAPGGGAASNIYTPGTSTPGSYTYTLNATAPCINDQATVTVTQNNPVNAGTDGAVTVCSDGTNADLFALLGGPDPGGSWAAPGGGASSSTYTPGTSVPGVYTYTVAALAPCVADQSIVTVTQNNPVNAGTDGAATVCADGGNVDLFSLLGGPEPGGAWSAPGGGASGSTYTPGTSAPGIYTYLISALVPCADDQATVTITQNTPVNAGADGAITVCSDGAIVDLFALLGGPDAGGSWTAPGGGTTSSSYTPGTGTPGVYTYTVVALAPCVNDQAVVTVTQNDPVNAGVDGAITVCEDGANVDLFSLLGTPDAGGTWTTPGGGSTTSIYTPGASAPGAYTYTVTALAPCANDLATVTVTQNSTVDAGGDGASTVCSDGPNVDLFSLLGAPDMGGAWTAPGGGATNSTYTPGASSPGSYTYTVVALAPCADDQSTVTITQNDPVNAGTDGTVTVCADGADVDLFTLLGGPDAGGTWAAPGGGVTTSNYIPGTSPPGTYTYTVAALAPCVSDLATVMVTQNNPVTAGADGAITVCSDGANTDLFALLGGPDAGGAWSAPGGGATGPTFTPGTSAPGIYYYTVTALAPCVDDQASVTVTQNDPVNAGTDGIITVCSTDPNVDLFSMLGGPDAGGTWSAPGGGATTSTYTPGTSAPGIYTYTVTAMAPCANDHATVAITQNVPPNAGSDGAVTLCISSPSTDLFSALGGTPDVGGTWTAPAGGASSGTFTPGTDATGTYTYTVPGTAPCAAVSATVTVAVVSLPNPGNAGSITLCTSGVPQDLFAVLGGTPDAGGTWTAPGGGAHSGTMDPTTDAAGVYTYTIAVPLPCTSVSSTVTVALQTPPDPGSDGAELLCVTSGPIDLLNSLQGTPDVGGAWSAPGGGAFNGSFVPGTSAPGTYTYTVSGTAPCLALSAEVDVSVTAIPDAGSNGSITLCTSGTQQDLFVLLGGSPDPGGSWSAPGGGAHSGAVDPDTDPAGVYTYQIVAPAPCPTVSSTVTVALQLPPDPGLSGNDLLCVTSAPIDLFSSLLGSPDPGGSWTAPGGGAFNGSFVPGTSVPGTYTYTVQGMAPCPLASSTVDVAVTDIPDAGTDGGTTLCTSGSAQDLFALLGGTPDSGGTWNAPGGGPHSGTLAPGNDLPGVYIYTIAAPAPCPSVSSNVTIALQAPPDPGSAGSALLCVTSPSLDLFTSVQGTPDAGGTWTAPGGGAFAGPFVPGISAPGIYTYTVAGAPPCPAASTTVEVTVMDIPDPGTPGSITMCTSGAAQDLFAVLGGAPDGGGAWTAPGGGAHSGTVDPSLDGAGVYTYTINVPPPCASVSSTVTVTLQAPPVAGTDGSLTLCISSPPADLFTSLLGTPDAGGTWTAPGGGPFNGDFLSGTSTPGVYTYTVQGTSPCPAASATVDVQVIDYPDPGINGLLTLCATDGAVQLFPSIGGSPDIGGTWTAPDGSAHVDLFDPGADAAGIYTYTIAVPAPCTSVSANVTVSVQQPPVAGTDGALSLCISGSATSLFAALAGTPDPGGAWSDPSSAPTDATFVPGTDVAGTYTYTVSGIAPCVSASASVQVAVNDEPDAGSNGAVVLCTGGASIDLFDQLGSSPDVGGSWTGPDGSSHSSTFDAAVDAGGVYTYTITVPPPCSSASSSVTVVVQSGPDPGTDGAITLCSTDAPVLLFTSLGGTPDATGTWTSPSGDPSDGTFDPATDESGEYTYTLIGVAPCPFVSSIVAVGVNTPPNAGGNGDLALCGTDAPHALFDELTGTPDTNGNWTAPDGSAHSGIIDPAVDAGGLYTYTLGGSAPCPSDDALVMVTVQAPPDAGIDGSLALCTNGASVDLFTALNGTPAASGAWTAPGGGSFSGPLDPATDQPGLYSYTVPGISPCPNAAAGITVSITAEPDAGGDGAILLCSASPAVDLFDHLSGTPSAGGAWSAPGGGVSDGTFDPGADAPGLFSYTLLGTTPCPNATATVLVNVSSNPDAGLPGSATLCMSDTPTPLLSILTGTPDAGGTWTGPDGLPHSATLDPLTDAPGTYSYIIDVPPPCVSASSSVSIALVAPADPGLDGGVTLCTNSATEELFAHLGGTPASGGIWTVSGIPHTGTFDPVVDVAGTYVYTLASSTPCPSVSAEIEVQLNSIPDPGTDGTAVLCVSGAPVELGSFLGGTPAGGGTWTLDGLPHMSILDPGSDQSGSYTYTVNGIAPCPSASADITVTIATEPDAGNDGLRTVCTSDALFDLFAELGGTPDAGGTWSGPSAVPDGQFDPLTMAGGVYTYLLSVPPPCASASSVVTIIAVEPPDPGTAGSALLCVSSPATDLFSVLLGGPEPGGTWAGPDGTPHDLLFNPASDPPGDYTYTLAGIVPCPSAQAVVTMNVVDEPDAGNNGSLTLCASDMPTDLFAQLNGSPDGGGSWSGPSSSPDGSFDPAFMLPGTYTYTLDAPDPCPDASSNVLVDISIPPDPGADGSLTLCTTSDAVDLFTLLTGTPEASGTWTAPGGEPHANLFNPAQDPAGAYTYTVTGEAPCPSASAVVTMSLSQPPDAGLDGSITLCPDADAVDLFSLIGGSPDEGGNWTAPGGAPHSGLMDPSSDPEGTYAYALSGVPPCGHDASVVIVEVSEPVTAAAATSSAVCNGSCDGTASLNILTGTPGYAMQWSGGVAGGGELEADGLCAGDYGVTITDANGCIGTVNYTIEEPPPLVIDAVGIGDENCIGSCDGYLNIVDNEGVLFSIDGGQTWLTENVISDLCAGGYLVTMQDAHGCLASTSVHIASPPPVTAGFYGAPDTMSVTNTTVAFTNQSGHAETFLWDFGGLATSTEGNPTFTFPDVLGGVYTVCLIAMDDHGCADSTCLPIVVLDELFVTVPNAFSPNGDDINDLFVPVFNIPANADEYNFMIFDRWGLRIFTSETVGETWDGDYNGEIVQQDVYVWKMHCKDRITREEYDLVGHVTVVK